MDYSPQGHKELDMTNVTEHTCTHTYVLICTCLCIYVSFYVLILYNKHILLLITGRQYIRTVFRAF